jgi:hypothetical protein
MNTGELREGDVLDYRANGWVVELHKDDVVLARGLWRPAKARGSRGARARGHQGRGKRSGPGGNDAWEGKPAEGGAIGGGRAAAGAKHCRRQASRAGTHVREEEEERGEVRGTCL